MYYNSSLTFLILLCMMHTIYGSDFYFVFAGSDTNVTDLDNIKVWSKNMLTVKAIGDENMIDPNLFSTAILSDTLFNIRFWMSEPGRKYIRLYFYSSDYFYNYDVPSFSKNNVTFSIGANMKVLTAFNNSRASFFSGGIICSMLEFSVYVPCDTLTLSFAPEYEDRNTFAFINGIEIVSHPNIYNGNAALVGEDKQFVMDDQLSLENIARVNVGGDPITNIDDGPLRRGWDNDEPFIDGDDHGMQTDATQFDTTITYPPPNFSEFVAPKSVYQTARSMGTYTGSERRKRMRWIFPLDPYNYAYKYLIRLHFCEVEALIKVNERVFDIYLNGKLAESGADVVAWTKKPGVPVYKDYVISVAQSAKPLVWIDLSPNFSTSRKYYDILLNGIEIFKISDGQGNLNVDFDPLKNLTRPNSRKCSSSPFIIKTL